MDERPDSAGSIVAVSEVERAVPPLRDRRNWMIR
jgi:hypothetical protein